MPYIVQTELYTGGKCFTIVQILIASIRKFKLWSVLSKHMVQLIKHTMNAVNFAVFKKKTNKQKKNSHVPVTIRRYQVDSPTSDC